MVQNLLGGIFMSSVNISEVAAILLDSDMSVTECREIIEPFVDSIIQFDNEQAFNTASIKKLTRHKGLSLGDRACIALGISLKLPIYTADKAWMSLNLEGAEIRLIR